MDCDSGDLERRLRRLRGRPCGFPARPLPCCGGDTPPGLTHTAWSDGSITHTASTKVPSFAAALTSEAVANLLRAASRAALVSTGWALPAGTPTSSSAVAEESGKMIASTPSPSGCICSAPGASVAAPVAAGADGEGAVAEGEGLAEVAGDGVAEGEGDVLAEPDWALSWSASPATVTRSAWRWASIAPFAVASRSFWNPCSWCWIRLAVRAVDRGLGYPVQAHRGQHEEGGGGHQGDHQHGGEEPIAQSPPGIEQGQRQPRTPHSHLIGPS